MKEKIQELRNNLYDRMPTGRVDAFELVKLINSHIEKLDELIDEKPVMCISGKSPVQLPGAVERSIEKVLQADLMVINKGNEKHPDYAVGGVVGAAKDLKRLFELIISWREMD